MRSRVMSSSDQLLAAGTLDRDVHRRSLRPAQLLEHVVLADAHGRHAVDLDDAVAGADAEAIRGAALDRRDDGQVAVADGERDADPEVIAPVALVHLSRALGST